MQRRQLEFLSNFHVVAGNERSQAAVMVLAKGDSTGGPENRHESSDQWLYVVSGEGKAVVEQQDYVLKPGTLLLIERNESHAIINQGNAPLKTVNFYVPPAYHGREGAPPSHD
ncbi:cupin domain-containing protein [Novipirellula caenicola]|uniref:Cupin type-2 domain-containing protein n=1 Tax=Novipirellula caenicola TaxID=1536901 RepID=A0ABP9VRY6_9BACT